MKTKAYKTHYLEMTSPGKHSKKKLSKELCFLPLENPLVTYYRFLFISIGKPWLWVSRQHLNNEQLANIIQNKNTFIEVLHVNGNPAGFYELDITDKNNIELVFFGLNQAYMGKGLGNILMEKALEKAWSYHPKKVWLHTCELDSDVALKFYVNSGFEVVRSTLEDVTLPQTEELESFYHITF